MNTIENNRLIAEFMGFIQSTNNHYQCCFGKINRTLPPQYMEFDSNWSWIMEVVTKIENLTDKNNLVLFDCSIFSDYVTIQDQHGNEIVMMDKAEDEFSSKIELIYKACVGFIIWYNNNKL